MVRCDPERSGGEPRTMHYSLPRRLLHYVREHLRLVDGELGERFAVELDLLRLQPADERRVLRAGGSERRVQADDPERAEIALLFAAVAVGMLPGLHHGFLCLLETRASRIVIPLSEAADFAVPAVSGDSGFNTHRS